MLFTNSVVRIRPATLDDIDDIIAANIECLPEHYPLSFWREHIEKWGRAFYVAEVDGKVVGYVMPRVEEGTGFIKPVRRRLGHIVSVAVREKYRRRGLATMMMLATLESLKREFSVEEAYLEVRVSNEPAIRLYQKLSFVIVKRIESYYLDGEDAYVMAREL
ncbi:MAG TPA: N-acetyltransferase [Ignisphaera aggregans]|uniref:N-acetyltransferase n=1 Tax=Ignisphaera aggregans TaxID=334771 RepID=A0A833DUB9_9CREN|nr:N-acetyltransferase [Ignisphaera aggregans]